MEDAVLAVQIEELVQQRVELAQQQAELSKLHEISTVRGEMAVEKVRHETEIIELEGIHNQEVQNLKIKNRELQLELMEKRFKPWAGLGIVILISIMMLAAVA